MEIVLNEEKLKEILNEEAFQLMKKAEEIAQEHKAKIDELENDKKMNEINKKIGRCFAFYAYFDDYVKNDDYNMDGYSYVVWRDKTDVYKLYIDLIFEYGRELVDSVIVERIKNEADKLESGDE